MKKYLLLWCMINLISLASMGASTDEPTADHMPPEDLAALKAIFLYTTNSGSAFPIGNNLNILGGTGITTSAEQSTITINSTVAESFLTDSGTATPSSNTIDIHGGSNINTSGSGSTVTINLNSSPSVSGSVTAGTGLIATTGGINATGNSSITGGTITLNSGTNALNISTDNAATTVAIADGAAAKTVIVGSTNGASSLELQAGSGGISLVGTATATTQLANDDSTKLATTAYADNSNPYRLLSTQTISNMPSVEFTHLPTGYSKFQVKCYNLIPVTNNEPLVIQYSDNNGSSWISTGYYGSIIFANSSSSGSAQGVAVSDGSSLVVIYNISNAISGYTCSGELNVTNIGTYQALYPAFYGRGTMLQNSSYMGIVFSGGYLQATECNAFQLFFSSGNIQSGTFELYAVL